MHSIRKIIRTGTLYIFSLMLIASAPLSVYAEQAPAETTTTPVTTDQAPAVEPQSTTPQTSETPTNTPVSPDASSPIPDSAPTTQPSTTAPAATTPGGSDTASTDTAVSASTDTKTDATIDTGTKSTAQSGDAAITQNTNAGDATTGNANGQTTVINSVHSTVGGDTTGVAYFTTDIKGNVYGDITISPSINSATQLSNANMSSATNIENNDTINNTITSSATSGNALVSENTNAGNATTGNANTVANVMNLINTIIAANKSFVGTINIYGDLNGDILISPEFIPQLLGSNTSTSTIDTSLSANLESNQQIINNIKLSAQSGSATVSENTNAGSATTGTAQTNLTVLNLTGHAVTAQNSLLVFVNVLGKWVGMIVDAPVGATAAALGNGVTSNTVTANSALSITDSAKITNSIDLTSKTGDATVSKNTNAGNATTGNATASANIANISASAFNISDWFGVLFINVFGTWEGSFGINTANGDIVPIAVPEQQNAVPASAPFAFGFTPKTSNVSKARTAGILASTSSYAPDDSQVNDTTTPTAAVLGANTSQIAPTQVLKENTSPRQNPFNNVMMFVGFGIAAVGAAIFAVRRS